MLRSDALWSCTEKGLQVGRADAQLLPIAISLARDYAMQAFFCVHEFNSEQPKCKLSVNDYEHCIHLNNSQHNVIADVDDNWAASYHRLRRCRYGYMAHTRMHTHARTRGLARTHAQTHAFPCMHACMHACRYSTHSTCSRSRGFADVMFCAILCSSTGTLLCRSNCTASGARMRWTGCRHLLRRVTRSSTLAHTSAHS